MHTQAEKQEMYLTGPRMEKICEVQRNPRSDREGLQLTLNMVQVLCRPRYFATSHNFIFKETLSSSSTYLKSDALVEAGKYFPSLMMFALFHDLSHQD